MGGHIYLALNGLSNMGRQRKALASNRRNLKSSIMDGKVTGYMVHPVLTLRGFRLREADGQKNR